MCGPVDRHEELALAPSAFLGELVPDGGWQGASPAQSRISPGSRAGWCQGCRVSLQATSPATRASSCGTVPRTGTREGAGKMPAWGRCAHMGGLCLPLRRQGFSFCLNWELNVGRLQGQFVQLDCGHISKWVQGQGRLRKQEMCLCSRNIYQVK